MTSQQPAEEDRIRVALLLEYDGSCYGGSQIQKNAPTIQGSLEGAIKRLTGETARVAFAGRTDAGVHARGQVASFLTDKPFDEKLFVDGLNYWLPDDIAVRRACKVAPGFDVRRQATGRSYRYLVHNDRSPSPLLRQRVWHVKQPLDVPTMQQAAECLAGRHDFAAFAGALERAGASTVRTVSRFEAREIGPLVRFDVRGDAFLPHQVRRMVGALAEVGLGRQEAAWIEELLREAKPSSAGPAAPPQGLCLTQVTYPKGILDFGEGVGEACPPEGGTSVLP
jgi:tRNA pseudouridine38-40 synthase